MFARKLQSAYVLYSIQVTFHTALFSLGFTPWKAEQPLQGMKLQEKEAQKN